MRLLVAVAVALSIAAGAPAAGGSAAFVGGPPRGQPVRHGLAVAADSFSVFYSTTTSAGTNTDGGTAPGDPNVYQLGDTVTVLDNTGALTLSGYTFVGWCDSDNAADPTGCAGNSYAPGDTFSMPGNDVTLYSQWTQTPTYSVSYNATSSDGGNRVNGTAPDDPNTYVAGATVTVLDNTASPPLTLLGYVFAGWCDTDNAADPTGCTGNRYAPGATFTMPASNVQLYSVWNYGVNYWAVTSDGATIANGTPPQDPVGYAPGQTVTVLDNMGAATPPGPPLTLDGYAFLGWCDVAGAPDPTTCDGTLYAPGSTFTMPSNPVDLYPTWIREHYVTYNTVTSDGTTVAEGSAPQDTTAYLPGHAVTLLDNTGSSSPAGPPLTLDGYTFSGWCDTDTAADPTGCGGTFYAPGDALTMPSSDVQLYSVWVFSGYAVTYSTLTSDGAPVTAGTAPVDPFAPYAPGETVFVPGNSRAFTSAPLRLDGYGFTGWCTTDDAADPTSCTGLFYPPDATFRMPAGDVTLYSVWAPLAMVAPSSFTGTDGGPYALATGDFNGDGIPDLVTPNQESASDVSVLLGNGDGTFRDQLTFGAGAAPEAVAVGDFNGDGFQDLAVANADSNTVSVLLGNGNGTFQPQQTFDVGAQPDAIATGDFNGDGVPDLAVANNADGTTLILLGNGDGTFTAAATVNASGTSIAVADLNGDGKQDVILAGPGGLLISLGNGDGTFQPAQSVDPGMSPLAVAVGDFNGDGVPDIAVGGTVNCGCSLASVVGVLLGNGDGTFQAPQTYMLGDPLPYQLAVGDFNGDGKEDLAAPSYLDDDVAVLLGNGDGSFSRSVTFPVGDGPDGVAVADFDRDGKPDIGIANYPGSAGALINDTAGFGSAALPVTSSTAGAGSVLIDELRLGGPTGSGDQMVELYNTRSTAVSVGGWQLQASGGGLTTIPLGTEIPGYGHYLFSAPGSSYSLPAYAAPNMELPNGPLLETSAGGVRLVAPDGAVIDRVGFTDAPAGFRAGAGLAVPPLLPSGQFAWIRDFSAGVPVNTNDNASDFSFVSTSDNDAGHGSPVLGAPGPGDLASPTMHNDILQSTLLDPSVDASAYPNRIYSAGSPGSLTINRSIFNCSGMAPIPTTPCANQPVGTAPKTVTRLRLRITGLTTIDSPGAGPHQAVLAADSSGGESSLDPNSNTCNGTTDVLGIPLDQPSVSGNGGLNSTWTVTADLPGGGLPPGGCINIAFAFDVQQTGTFSFAYNAEDDLKPAHLPRRIASTHCAPNRPVPSRVTGTLTGTSTKIPPKPKIKPSRAANSSRPCLGS